MENILTEFEGELLKTKEAANSRIGAFIIDFTLQLIISVVYIRLLGEEISPGYWKVEGTMAMPIIAFWFAYFILLEGLFGKTVGKKIVGIKVLSADGTPASIGQSFVRRLGDLIDIYWCFGILGFILIKSTKNNQRLGDRWAKTVVTKA